MNSKRRASDRTPASREALWVTVGCVVGLAVPCVTALEVVLMTLGYVSAFRLGAVLFGHVCIAPTVVVVVLWVRSKCEAKLNQIILLALACLNAGLFAYTSVSTAFGART